MEVYADTPLVMPVEFLNNVSNKAQFRTDLPFLERVLSEQIYKNTQLNDVRLTDYSAEGILKYFNSNNAFRQVSPTMLVEPRIGATLIFQSDGRCDGNSCKILVDLNGDKGPNQFWTDSAAPQDRVIFNLRKTGNGGLDVEFPNLR